MSCMDLIHCIGRIYFDTLLLVNTIRCIYDTEIVVYGILL
jgi:hypothetical protein